MKAEKFDWTRALDALRNGHNLAACEKVREMMAAWGFGPLPLSLSERDEAARLRQAAARNIAAAEAIEARAKAAP